MSDIQRKTLGKLFLKKARSKPEKEILAKIVDNELNFVTFQELENSVKCISLALIKLGAGPETKVCILSQTSMEWHLFDVAIMCSRGIVVPIYPSYLSSEIEQIYNHSESSLLIVEDEIQLEKVIPIQDKLNKLKTIISIKPVSKGLVDRIAPSVKFVDYQELLKIGEEEKSLHENTFFKNIEEQQEEDIATIVYTSGTTGLPKGAVIKHRAFVTMISNVTDAYKGAFGEADRSLVFLPLSHVLGRADSMLYLGLGLQSVYAESIDKLIDNLPIVRPTMMISVPRIFEKIYTKVSDQIETGSPVKRLIFNWAQKVSNIYFDKLDNDLKPSMLDTFNKNLGYKLVFSKIYNRFGGRVRFFISGGAPLCVDIIKFCRNAHLSILEGYGLTETIAPCFGNPGTKQVPGTVGVPLGDVQMKFSDDKEILIKSDALFSEYYKDPQETKQVLQDGWLYTGDIGEMDPHGFLKITDRKKDIIVTSGGKNVAPQKLENMAKTHRHLTHLAVVGDRKKYLTAIVGIEKEAFHEHLETMNLSTDASVKELSSQRLVRELIQGDIDQINSELAQFETIKKFYIAPSEFSVETGELTPSLKLKKKTLFKQFENEINEMYS